MEDEYCPHCGTYGQHSNYQCEKNIDKLLQRLEKEKSDIIKDKEILEALLKN